MASVSTNTITQGTKTLKLSGNPLENEKTTLIKQLSDKIENTKHGDWRDDLLKDGYVVVKNAISKEKAQDYQNQIFDWLRSFNKGWKLDDESTWNDNHLPDHHWNNIYSKHSTCHEKFFWDIRLDPGFKDKFAKLWGTNELLVSFDAINIAFPTRDASIEPKFWPHVDQSPFRTGLSCVQGIANLSEAGEKDGGLVVYKDSHKLLENFFKEVYGEENWESKDNVQISKDQLQWFLDNGAEKVKVIAEPGDLILWDSRTIHYGSGPEYDSNNIRTIAYISYSPANFATEENLIKKRQAFEKWHGTTHWAHDNINTRNLPAYLPNGELDPYQRTEPNVKPELTKELLQLAGVVPY
ncbi:hypothetical protein BN7_6363 [Wickerhamomyces ciferrii]|uniref:Phytanoyl-CoA dioxygenase n=1 Tax=Wickerhamomyces ciferrii (strain ATCC 14091 / BCRC 22168 / CBS 111 / JCM 3599 / NBRC 0793 / NRRL Y-1031 F-60-10) TaxID=1206466 RepID=K0KZM6_WICCF|nr:uncharacterized protein BN7_6363 [Wickerhamomyces ciferrii]CCH46764.1 hypothetical protein BN7_6363 [Wickerhamomyces ciferrii]